MTTFDLSPLYRTAIGFDRLADMLSNASRVDGNGYPPYNIEASGEDQYRISMAVAGFLGIRARHRDRTEHVDGFRPEGRRRRAGRARVPVPGHRDPLVRTPLPACRPRSGCFGQARERLAAYRSPARTAGEDEAAPHRDWQRGLDPRTQIDESKAQSSARRSKATKACFQIALLSLIHRFGLTQIIGSFIAPVVAEQRVKLRGDCQTHRKFAPWGSIDVPIVTEQAFPNKNNNLCSPFFWSAESSQRTLKMNSCMPLLSNMVRSTRSPGMAFSSALGLYLGVVVEGVSAGTMVS